MKNITMEKTKMKKGHTLVEWLIVVAILGLLAAIAIPSYIKAIRTGEIKENGYEQSWETGFWYHVDTREIIDVSKDLKHISEPIGKINCTITEFRSMEKTEALRQITFYQDVDPVVFYPVENTSDTIVVDGVEYKKVK